MTEGSELVKFRVISLKGLRGIVVSAWAFHSVGHRFESQRNLRLFMQLGIVFTRFTIPGCQLTY